MTVKLTGAEMNAFMVDPAIWGKEGEWSGRWYDDAYIEVDGEPNDLEFSFRDGDVLPADATVSVEGGCLYRDEDANSVFDDLEPFLRRWLKARTVTTITIEVAKDRAEAVKAMLTAENIRVVG